MNASAPLRTPLSSSTGARSPTAATHGCHIERGCLIGMGSIVMDDVRIGAQSIVAAGALVSPGTKVPPRSLVIGVPAKVKRPLTDEEVAGLDRYWQNYVEYTKVYRDEAQG